MTAEEWLADADTLDRAAAIFRRDSAKPRSILLAVICKLLTEHAETLRRRARRSAP